MVNVLSAQLIRYFLTSAMLLISCLASADAIDDVFSDGVFDTKWGYTASDVKAVFPSAEKKLLSGIEWLEVRNSEPVLGFNRNDEKIHFSFDSEGRLNGVAVYFSDDQYGALLVKLETLFGKWKKGDITTVPYSQWVSERGITLTLAFSPSTFSTQTVFSIGYPNLQRVKATKDSLGF